MWFAAQIKVADLIEPLLDPERRADRTLSTNYEWFQYGRSMWLCGLRPGDFDFPLKQQSPIPAFQRRTPCLTVVVVVVAVVEAVVNGGSSMFE